MLEKGIKHKKTTPKYFFHLSSKSFFYNYLFLPEDCQFGSSNNKYPKENDSCLVHRFYENNKKFVVEFETK